MKLLVRRLPLQCEIIQSNRAAINSLNHKNYYNVVKKLGVSPDSKLAKLVYDAIVKGVKILKTKDKTILAYASMIELNFNIKVMS
jgi:hypothetical protein